MAELAASEEHREKFRSMDPDRVVWLEEQITRFSQTIEISTEFVVFGDSGSSAAFNLARTIVRRAERVVAKLHHESEMAFEIILKYLNRLSSLCFVIALWEMQRGR